MKIPVHNVYYLLSYAWDQLEQSKLVSVDATDFTELLDLFAHVLETATARLLKQGLDRAFIDFQEEVPGVVGKLCLAQTLKQNTLIKSRTVCRFSALSYNVVHNQILKTTICNLLKTDGLNTTIRKKLHTLAHRLHEVDEIRINNQSFRRVQLHRNIRSYAFLLNLCHLIHAQLRPNESKGTFTFPDFTRDKRSMERLFERFVLNFFRKEQTVFKSNARRFPWSEVVATAADLEFLPGMLTDITLESPDRTIVIDTKYYLKWSITTPSGKRRVRPSHLYQIYAYISNLREAGYPEPIEGILLYPSVDEIVDLVYEIHGFSIRIKTLDLNRPWNEIHNRLLSLLPSAQ
jgi:5-methylcytosine-specific restriction enzyme subunit McrC